MKKALLVSLALSLTCVLSGCGNGQKQDPGEKSVVPAPAESAPVEVSAPEQTFEDISTLFEGIIEDADVTLDTTSGRADVCIGTKLPSESEPDNWQNIIDGLSAILPEAKEASKQHELWEVTVTVTAADDSVLASGYGASIKYDAFLANDASAHGKNPPTISLDEFNRISIGMPISEVRDIIGSNGTLSSEYGEPGGDIPLTQMYIWDGERLGANAVISFENYTVTHKTAVGLN